MSASLHTHHTTPQPRPRASHDPVHYDKRPVFCHPPGLSLPGVPPVSPRACQCPVSCHTSGPVLALLSPPRPSPPSITSCHAPGLCWPYCHRPGLHQPASPPVTPRACGGAPNSPVPITARCPVTPQACHRLVSLLSPPGLSPPAVPSSQQPARARQPGGDAAGFAVWRSAARTAGPAKAGDISACLSLSWCIYGKFSQRSQGPFMFIAIKQCTSQLQHSHSCLNSGEEDCKGRNEPLALAGAPGQ